MWQAISQYVVSTETSAGQSLDSVAMKGHEEELSTPDSWSGEQSTVPCGHLAVAL